MLGKDLDQHIEFQRLVESLKKSDGFMLSAALLDAQSGRISHILLTEQFPEVDLLRSFRELRELAIKQLESKPVNIVDFKLPEKDEETSKDGLRKKHSK